VFRCLETVAAKDSSGSHRHALKYIGDDGRIHQLLDDDANYFVEKDGCQTKSQKKDRTVFTITSFGNNLKVLPVRDFSIGDFFHRDQKFGMKIGPVCFL